jgi:hypothetical protein
MVQMEFGALCNPILKQLNDQGYNLSEEDNKRLQAIADAITLLKLHGIIPDSIANKGYEKLMKMIGRSESLVKRGD